MGDSGGPENILRFCLCVQCMCLSRECMGLLTRIQWIRCKKLRFKCVPAARFLTTLLSSGLSEEQSFLSVSQSVFGEMIVGFRERAALFGQEQARIALFPFITILLLSPPNILLLSFCPFLPYSSLPLFLFLLFIPASPVPTPGTRFSSPNLSPSVSPSPD